MEIIRRLLALLVISSVAILAIHVSSTVAAQSRVVSQVIRDTCQQATHPDFCVSVLSSDDRSLGRKYPGQLTYLAIVISYEKAKEGRNHVADEEKKTTDPLVKKILNYCLDRYDIGAVDGTESAIKEFDNGNKRLAAIDLSAVFGPLDECIGAFNRPPYPANPIGATNELVTKYCYLALELLHSVGGK
ncbi:hypothetical protein H6P81_017261 [Aristolochia fimbriata]|uniref:Pectinesterase inhibitor domain-containing protein n=1 Tax=Aristolochia fimbriata TaxID=158543 RepID=A0AAV7E0N5_ARIFI|nr:hypothetical protein H6P81_017261 [Aristolochia fimbriata]